MNTIYAQHSNSICVVSVYKLVGICHHTVWLMCTLLMRM